LTSIIVLCDTSIGTNGFLFFETAITRVALPFFAAGFFTLTLESADGNPSSFSINCVLLGMYLGSLHLSFVIVFILDQRRLTILQALAFFILLHEQG
jgi:hypothetical protein